MTTNLIEIQLMYVFHHYMLSLTRVKDTKGLPTSCFSKKFEIFNKKTSIIPIPKNGVRKLFKFTREFVSYS